MKVKINKINHKMNFMNKKFNNNKMSKMNYNKIS